MPYETTWVDPAVLVEHRGVIVYHTYENDDAELGPAGDWYTTNPEYTERLDDPIDLRDVAAAVSMVGPGFGAGDEELFAFAAEVFRRAIDAGLVAAEGFSVPSPAGAALGASVGTVPALLPHDLTEDAALDLFRLLCDRFQWAGAVFTRSAAESFYLDTFEDDGEARPDAMPAEVWDRVTTSWQWRQGMPDIMCRHGFELLTDAVSEAMDSGEPGE